METSKKILYRQKDTAHYFRISTMTLWRWEQRNGFPKPIRYGGVVLYNIHAIENWLINHE